MGMGNKFKKREYVVGIYGDDAGGGVGGVVVDERDELFGVGWGEV